MRKVICILTLLFAVYASKQDVTKSSVNFKQLVNIYKEIMGAILNDVLRLEKQIKQILQVRLNDLKTRTLLKINNIINSTFENINLSIEKAKKEGKEINECYNYAKHNLETRKDNILTELETRIQYVNTTMKAPLTNVTNNIKAIKTLLTDLNTIIPKCYSLNYIKMQSCIAMNLAQIKLSLKDSINNAITLVNTVTTAFTYIIRDVKNNMIKLVVDFRIFNIRIIVHINSCIRNAFTDNFVSINNSTQKSIVIY